MKVLITGASGLLGKYMARTVPDGVEPAFTWHTVQQPWCRHQLNVTNPDAVAYVAGKVKPDAIVHMAAVGDVDWCQRNYRDAWKVNVEGTRNVLSLGVPTLMTSTNAVYSGDDPPYGESAPQEPVNAYGKIRREAERAMKGRGWIARLFLLYGWQPPGARGNWATNALDKLLAGGALRVVDDVWYMPTYAEDAARAVWKMLTLPEGAYNVAGEERVTLLDFVRRLAGTWGLDAGRIEPCSITEFPSIAPRPRDTAYDLAHSKSFGLGCRGVGEGLEAMRREDPL